MKQFQCTFPNGTKSLAYTPAEVCQLFPLSVAAVSDLNVGETAVDRDGVWTRLPDLGETPIISDKPKRDERLERIATAAMVPGLAAVMRSPDIMAALLQAAGEKGTTLPDMVAVDAVAFAKALIAELDKQA